MDAIKLMKEANDLYNRLYSLYGVDNFKLARVLFRASRRFDRRMDKALMAVTA